MSYVKQSKIPTKNCLYFIVRGEEGANISNIECYPSSMHLDCFIGRKEEYHQFATIEIIKHGFTL